LFPALFFPRNRHLLHGGAVSSVCHQILWIYILHSPAFKDDLRRKITFFPRVYCRKNIRDPDTLISTRKRQLPGNFSDLHTNFPTCAIRKNRVFTCIYPARARSRRRVGKFLSLTINTHQGGLRAGSCRKSRMDLRNPCKRDSGLWVPVRSSAGMHNRAYI